MPYRGDRDPTRGRARERSGDRRAPYGHARGHPMGSGGHRVSPRGQRVALRRPRVSLAMPCRGDREPPVLPARGTTCRPATATFLPRHATPMAPRILIRLLATSPALRCRVVGALDEGTGLGATLTKTRAF